MDIDSVVVFNEASELPVAGDKKERVGSVTAVETRDSVPYVNILYSEEVEVVGIQEVEVEEIAQEE